LINLPIEKRGKNVSDFQKPVVVISKCIEFENCRWNGNIIKSSIVKILKSYVDFHPVCAEIEIGLGVPRNPVRLILEDEEIKMIQPSSNRDCTLEMTIFAEKFLTSLGNIDGFILKSQSPSCGLFQTKYYQSAKKRAPKLDRGPGLFGRAVLNMCPTKAIETEGRLTNFRIREHWLIKLFTLADFQNLKQSLSKHQLVNFHTKNKFLFMSYNQQIMRDLGKIVANPKKLKFEEIISEYETKLNILLQKPPEYTSHLNVLMHALGYFKKELSHSEKGFFLDELEKFRAGWIPLFVLSNLIKSWIVRFNQTYLNKQSYFDPYPEELMNFDLKDSWRGRSYWE
jgi:uncharacterized protein YbgA (DUF1722 family)/uncharacterized protein YbbK (DUF523 family)